MSSGKSNKNLTDELSGIAEMIGDFNIKKIEFREKEKAQKINEALQKFDLKLKGFAKEENFVKQLRNKEIFADFAKEIREIVDVGKDYKEAVAVEEAIERALIDRCINFKARHSGEVDEIRQGERLSDEASDAPDLEAQKVVVAPEKPEINQQSQNLVGQMVLSIEAIKKKYPKQVGLIESFVAFFNSKLSKHKPDSNRHILTYLKEENAFYLDFYEPDESELSRQAEALEDKDREFIEKALEQALINQVFTRLIHQYKSNIPEMSIEDKEMLVEKCTKPPYAGMRQDEVVLRFRALLLANHKDNPEKLSHLIGRKGFIMNPQNKKYVLSIIKKIADALQNKSRDKDANIKTMISQLGNHQDQDMMLAYWLEQVTADEKSSEFVDQHSSAIAKKIKKLIAAHQLLDPSAVNALPEIEGMERALQIEGVPDHMAEAGSQAEQSIEGDMPTIPEEAKISGDPEGSGKEKQISELKSKLKLLTLANQFNELSFNGRLKKAESKTEIKKLESAKKYSLKKFEEAKKEIESELDGILKHLSTQDPAQAMEDLQEDSIDTEISENLTQNGEEYPKQDKKSDAPPGVLKPSDVPEKDEQDGENQIKPLIFSRKDEKLKKDFPPQLEAAPKSDDVRREKDFAKFVLKIMNIQEERTPNNEPEKVSKAVFIQLQRANESFHLEKLKSLVPQAAFNRVEKLKEYLKYNRDELSAILGEDKNSINEKDFNNLMEILLLMRMRDLFLVCEDPKDKVEVDEALSKFYQSKYLREFIEAENIIKPENDSVPKPKPGSEQWVGQINAWFSNQQVDNVRLISACKTREKMTDEEVSKLLQDKQLQQSPQKKESKFQKFRRRLLGKK